MDKQALGSRHLSGDRPTVDTFSYPPPPPPPPPPLPPTAPWGPFPQPAAPPPPLSRRPARRQRWVWAAAAVIVVLAAAGAVAVIGLSGKGTGRAAESPQQVLQAAQQAVKGVSSYEMKGSGDFGNGVSAVDFQIHDGDVGGSLTMSGSVMQMMTLGDDLYVNAPASFYEAEGAGDAASIVAGKWLEIPASSALSGVSAITSLSYLTDLSKALKPQGEVVADGTGIVGGQSVVIIKDSANGDTMAVAASGTAYPVQLRKATPPTWTLDLSNWNSVPAFTPPPNPITVPGS